MLDSVLGSAGHKVSLKGQQVGQQIISQYVEQRAKSREECWQGWGSPRDMSWVSRAEEKDTSQEH